MTYILKYFFLVILLWLASDSIAYKYGKYNVNDHKCIAFKNFMTPFKRHGSTAEQL